MAADGPLDDRKSAILRAVVQQYIETAQPVGSTTVAHNPDVGVSSATVRNDMTVLEREGYLAQPHTSAGRVPTEKGYRFFVDGLAGADTPSPTNVRAVRDFFATAHGEIESMLRETTRLLASLTHSAAVVVGDAPEVATLRSVQLVDLSPRTVLVVAVLSNGVVLKRTFDPGAGLDGPAGDAELASARGLIEATLVGSTVTDLGAWTAPPGVAGAAIVDVVVDVVRAAAAEAGQQVYVDGAADVAGSFETRDRRAGPDHPRAAFRRGVAAAGDDRRRSHRRHRLGDRCGDARGLRSGRGAVLGGRVSRRSDRGAGADAHGLRRDGLHRVGREPPAEPDADRRTNGRGVTGG